ncbi:MAG: diphosphate--fructose-6-phosphate 1-phosphotransferase, partial [Treponema sp.]|nr:diphosphate--fructose-6-phosphate 1-phosphotransferase [Treponema sp.]
MNISALQEARYRYQPKLPASLAGEVTGISVELGAPTESAADQEDLKAIFKHSYGKPIAVFG